VSLSAYDQIERIKDMQTMEEAMAEIQKGILYNNNNLVLEGVTKLKKAASTVEIAPKSTMEFSGSFAKRKADNIKKYADKIEENIKSGHKHGAARHYTNVLGECISCHNKIRKWN
jgi:cytochrome c556